jgi:hypothetical protein
MSRPVALTPAQKRQLWRLRAARRELIRQLKALPSKTDLAIAWNVSERTLGRWMNDAEARQVEMRLTIRELYLS